MRQPLPAHFRVFRQKRPAIVDQRAVSFREPVGRLDAGIIIALAALDITNMVEREQDFLGELATLFQDRVDQVGGRFLEAGQVRIVLQLQHFMQDELHIADRSVVTGHGAESL